MALLLHFLLAAANMVLASGMRAEGEEGKAFTAALQHRIGGLGADARGLERDLVRRLALRSSGAAGIPQQWRDFLRQSKEEKSATGTGGFGVVTMWHTKAKMCKEGQFRLALKTPKKGADAEEGKCEIKRLEDLLKREPDAGLYVPTLWAHSQGEMLMERFDFDLRALLLKEQRESEEDPWHTALSSEKELRHSTLSAKRELWHRTLSSERDLTFYTAKEERSRSVLPSEEEGPLGTEDDDDPFKLVQNSDLRWPTIHTDDTFRTAMTHKSIDLMHIQTEKTEEGEEEELEGLVERRKAEYGLSDVGKWIYEVYMGIKKLHRAGLCHRDIKPENIMVTSDGHAKIIDLGLACKLNYKKTDGDAGCDRSCAHLAGTPYYMPPQRVLLWSPGQVNSASVDCTAGDFWALGLVAGQLLARRSRWPPHFAGAGTLYEMGLKVRDAKAMTEAVLQLASELKETAPGSTKLLEAWLAHEEPPRLRPDEPAVRAWAEALGAKLPKKAQQRPEKPACAKELASTG